MSEWISVEDRLPKDKGKVLAVVKTSSREMIIVSFYSSLGGWQCGYGLQITHWMELPEPPKTDTL